MNANEIKNRISTIEKEQAELDQKTSLLEVERINLESQLETLEVVKAIKVLTKAIGAYGSKRGGTGGMRLFSDGSGRFYLHSSFQNPGDDERAIQFSYAEAIPEAIKRINC